MDEIEITKQLYLPDFFGIFKPGIIIREHMAAVGTGHLIQWPVAALGQNHGISRLNSRQVFGVGLAAGTGNVPVRFI